MVPAVNPSNMNDYDDQDDQDDYSSSNSFRARSNTWPLNRPDLALPSSAVCIDETLPEIELEDDDLFTTNENWSTGLVDQDIMSWDPILNVQNPQQHQQQQNQQQPSTLQHHPQQHRHNHQVQDQPQAQHQTHPVTQQLPPQVPITQGHQRHQSIHIQNHQSQQQTLHHLHHHHHLHQPQNHASDPNPQNDPFVDVANETSNRVLLATQNVVHMPQHQTQQRLSPAQHSNHIQHQTLNSVHCLDQDDPNEYHIHQMNHLSLDNNPTHPHEGSPQNQFAPTLTSICIHDPSANLNNDTSYNITSNQNSHHLQPLSSARYDDSQNDYDLESTHDENLNQHLEHQPVIQQPSNSHPQIIHQHHQHHHHHQSHHQLQTASSLDNHLCGPQLLSSTLITSVGVGLSGDLEDLDLNHSGDPSIMMPKKQFDDHQQQSETEPSEGGSKETMQSDSTPTTKTKLNAPRRNAWGNMSYADLISQAINSTSDKRLTLSQIYDWMVQHVPYFKDKGDSNSSAGWKNSVRHNLSLHSRFKRLQNEGTGKSSWWTINPEANVGKCARRRAASMEASKYEKKRGRAKKKAEAIRQGLISYPSLSDSSLNASTTALAQDSQAQPVNQFQTSQQQDRSQQQQQLQNLDHFADSQQHQSAHQPHLQVPILNHYTINQPSQQQQQHLQKLQQSDAQSCDDLNNHIQHDQHLFKLSHQPASQHHESHYGESGEINDIHRQQQQQQHQQQQQQQQQQSQYYYPFQLSTAL